MGKLIQVFNDDIDATALVPEQALAHYEERGWIRVELIEPDISAAGSPRKRGNDLEYDDDDLESDEDTSDDQEE